MKRVIGILTAVALLGLIPLVQAQEGEQKEEKPPAEAKPSPDEGAKFLERFDLDKDGRVTWEEFRKVRSGFTRLDADGDGVLTRADMEKLKERRAAMRQEFRQERARDGRRGRHPRAGRRGPRAGCDCACHRDRQHFRGPPRRPGPRGFRGRGWGRPDDDRPRRGPPPRGDWPR